MDVFPAENQVDGYDQALPAEETDKDDDDGGDLCRICRSPEGLNNPLRYPCACRGSIKYVHQECLRLWLNRRSDKQCEVCRHSYSFVPVYSENAPARLPCREFLRGVSLRALRFVAWAFAILFNAYCFSLHPWGRETAIENQRRYGVSEKLAAFLAGSMYNGMIAYHMTLMVLLRIPVGHLLEIVGENYIEHGVVVAGAAVALWKYMRILCDWWHNHLIRCRFFLALMFEPREEAVRPRNAKLDEFGAIRRFLFLLDDNTFAVLAISFYVSFFFVLLPFSMGKLVFAVLSLFQRMDVSVQLLSGDLLGQEPVIVGYMAMISLSLAYLASFVTLSRDSIQALAKRLSLGFLVVAVALPYLLWITSVKVWRNLSVVKDGFVLCLKFGVYPLVLGCWLDLSTFPILGTTVSRRLEIISEFPFAMIIHWLLGLICLLLVFNSVELIHKIILKRPFWFLLYDSDFNYRLTKLYLGQILFGLALHGSLMVILVHLPIMTISLISPSFFPLQLWIYDERILFGSMAAYKILWIIGAPQWLVELIKPAIEPIVVKWITTVSSWLQLSEFLLGNHEDQNVRPLLQQDLEIRDLQVESSLVGLYGSHSDTTFEDDIEDDRFMTLRIGLMCVLATLSLFLMSTISMALPILIGRAFFHSISFIGLKQDDLYGFWIGCYILREVYITTCFITDHIMTGRIDVLLSLVLLWIRNALLFTIWISVIPSLIGLLIILMIIIPLQVPLNQSPVYSSLQVWLISSVLFHIWTYLTMFTRIKYFATVAWREKPERIRNVGINRLPSMWLLRDVVYSIIRTLLATLVLPFLVTYSLFPSLGFSGAVNLAVQRLIWPVLLAIIILGFVAKLTIDLFVYIHRVEYDDRYLVGDRVTDFTEDLE
ncbi:unnamed protein product [Microthlaspi erraticum]|uniref:RING-CH-type domain-containing protein n=1 Tax=Microthlaspi erraticum TaxID=1685480 RepID=A0A6D2IK09_9BRAS|nr:unnamed protein product [Microthlaspi erraticum]